MARMIPSVISSNTGSPGEQEIFRKLKNDPVTKDWIVLHSLDIAEHNTQVAGEADFVIIIPGKGVLCLEVKSHRVVRRDETNRLWHFGRKTESRGPFKQASDAMHSLRTAVLNGDPALSRIVFSSAVVFPFSTFDVESPEWHSWQVIDKNLYRQASFGLLVTQIIDRAREFLIASNSAKWFHPERNEPLKNQCESIAGILRPGFEFINSYRTQRETLDSELLYYTEEQFEALDAMEAEPRVSFEGPAGTGKTVLALEAARRARNNGRKVLFLCFNKFLGKWLEQQVKEFEPGVESRTLHKHLLVVSGLKPENRSGPSSSFWKNDLPVAAAESLLDSEGNRFTYDEIIIDEAQDIVWNEYYLDFLDFSLRGGLTDGRWTLFGDYEKQSLYTKNNQRPKNILNDRGFPPASFFSYRLTRNCRNPPRIAEAVRFLGRMDPGYRKILRPDNGIEPEYIFYKSIMDQIARLADLLDRLSDEGFRGDDIVILSTNKDADCVASKINSAPWKGRLRAFRLATKGQIKYCSVHRFKGLEAPVIIVTDVASVATAEDQNLFYVGMTRAVDKLIVLTQVTVKDDFAKLLNSQTSI